MSRVITKCGSASPLMVPMRPNVWVCQWARSGKPLMGGNARAAITSGSANICPPSVTAILPGSRQSKVSGGLLKELKGVLGSKVITPLIGSPGAKTGSVVASAGTAPKTTRSASALPKATVMARARPMSRKRKSAFVECRATATLNVVFIVIVRPTDGVPQPQPASARELPQSTKVRQLGVYARTPSLSNLHDDTPLNRSIYSS
jgi:hypothetical protein